MTKKETAKFIVQLIASIATAILTALGATSCVGAWSIENWKNEKALGIASGGFVVSQQTTLL